MRAARLRKITGWTGVLYADRMLRKFKIIGEEELRTVTNISRHEKYFLRIIAVTVSVSLMRAAR